MSRVRALTFVAILLLSAGCDHATKQIAQQVLADAPVISLAAVQVRTLVGYTLIVETIFRWPGLGKRLVDSILTSDYQVAQGLTILLAAVVVASTLVSSFLYRAADPRVRDE